MTKGTPLPARAMLNLSRAEFAPMIGYSNARSIEDLEIGRRKPSRTVMLLMDRIMADHAKGVAV